MYTHAPSTHHRLCLWSYGLLPDVHCFAIINSAITPPPADQRLRLHNYNLVNQLLFNVWRILQLERLPRNWNSCRRGPLCTPLNWSYLTPPHMNGVPFLYRGMSWARSHKAGQMLHTFYHFDVRGQDVAGSTGEHVIDSSDLVLPRGFSDYDYRIKSRLLVWLAVKATKGDQE